MKTCVLHGMVRVAPIINKITGGIFMSYSLNRKCGSCKKKVRCLDSSFIMAAITGIHQANYDDSQRQVHLGAGSITINCCNYVDENTEEVKTEV